MMALPRRHAFQWTIVLLAQLLSTALFAATKDVVAPKDIPCFHRGVAIHNMMNWAAVEQSDPSRYAFPAFAGPNYETSDALLRNVAAAGFDFVRLTIDSGPFLQFTGIKREALDQHLREVVERLLRNGFCVIVDFHPASVIAAVAGLTGRDDLSISARDPHLRDVVFDSPQRSSGEERGLRVFERGGVSVANETLCGRDVHLVFDHGPLGLMPLAAHGHADALAIWLTIDGEPVFIDAGTYRYFSGGETRSALREGLAHNSLVIDGLTPSCAATPFSWTTCANARLIEVTHGPAWSVAGEHDGYRKRFGVRHVRRIRREEPGFFIDDQLVGNTRPLPVTIRFLCDPRVSIALDDDNVVIGGQCGLLCQIAPPRGFAIDIAERMHSQRFGHLAPTRQIILTGELADDVATTHVAIAGQAKKGAHLGDGVLVASRTQSDMREKVWH